ncbi:MAG: hypothetical protein LUE29_12640 [Lachnospiraceae bacterium]|nr:hypothetical protein [Lachnospiraceae bacterium]
MVSFFGVKNRFSEKRFLSESERESIGFPVNMSDRKKRRQTAAFPRGGAAPEIKVSPGRPSLPPSFVKNYRKPSQFLHEKFTTVQKNSTNSVQNEQKIAFTRLTLSVNLYIM